MTLYLVLIFIATAIYLPPIALFILILMTEKITIFPAIIYMFIAGMGYYIKNNGEDLLYNYYVNKFEREGVGRRVKEEEEKE